MDGFEEKARRDLTDLGSARMPFGKYGPENFPPEGKLLRELPLEYLAWFDRKGAFPKGRLGELMRIVHQMKVEGSFELLPKDWGRSGGGRS